MAGRARRRWMRGVGSTLLVLIGCAVAATIWWHAQIAEHALKAVLTRATDENVQLTVRSIDGTGITIERVAWANALSVDTIRLNWAPSTVFMRPFGEMTVIKGRLDLAALPPAGTAPASSDPLGPLSRFAGHLPAIVLEDFTLSGSIPGRGNVDLRADGTIEIEPSGLAASLRLRQELLPAPVTLNGKLQLATDDVRFEGRATLGEGVVSAGISGRHAMPSGVGSVRIVIDPIQFAGNSLGSLNQALSRLSDTIGSLKGEADMTWSGTTLRTRGHATLEDVGLTDKETGLKIDGLSGAIFFDSLTPPTTPPGQELRARRLDAWLEFEAPQVRFRLAEDTMVIESFQAGLMGGQVSIRNGRLGMTGEAELTFVVTGVELEPMLAMAGTNAVAGTGTLDGRLPITVADGAIEIPNVTLAARGPGNLRIQSDAARRVLAGKAQEVDWMLKALEDFRYDRLSVTLGKQAGGASTLHIETLGHNPDVLEGRPFEISINLEADFDRLARALFQALRLPGQLIRTIVREPR